MEKNVVALLHNNLRVIIPEFGAFIIRQKQPRIIVFNEFLRYNDGLLLDYLVKNEGIDREVAEQQVLALSEEWQKVLEKGKILTIAGIGTLQKDESGKIVFVQEGMEVEEETMELIPETPVVSEPGPEVQPEPAPEPEPDPMPEPEIIPEAIPEAIPETIPEVIPETIPEAIPETIPETIPESIPEPSPEPPVVTGEVRTFDAGSIGEGSSTPPQGRTRQILLWVILFLVVNAVVIGWYTFGKGKGSKEIQEPLTTSDSLFEQLADSVRAAAMDSSLVFRETTDSVKEEPAAVVTAPEPKATAVPEAKTETKPAAVAATGGNFYIVVNSFKDELNSDTYLKGLKKKGYTVVKLKRSEGLYSVCFGAYDTKDKAAQELNRLHGQFPGAWILQFNH